MTTENHAVTASVLTSVVTGLVSLVPDGVFGVAEKLISVLVLAMVAETGRRLVSKLWSEKK